MNRFIVFGILMILVSTGSAAVSLGSTSDVTSLALERGEYGVFSASFFNMGEEELDVTFEVEYPSDLRVELSPESLELDPLDSINPDSPGEYLILDGGKRYVRTYSVKVYVKIPSEISTNDYKIKLIARASPGEDSSAQGFEQSLVQVREILFSAQVDGRVENNEVEIIRVDASSDDSIRDEAEESFKKTSSSSSSSSSGSTSAQSPDYSQEWPTSSGSSDVGDAAEEEGVTVKDSSGFGLDRDDNGNTNLNLPSGKVSISEEQTNTAIDLGLVTLLVSIGSLVVRIIR